MPLGIALPEYLGDGNYAPSENLGGDSCREGVYNEWRLEYELENACSERAHEVSDYVSDYDDGSSEFDAHLLFVAYQQRHRHCQHSKQQLVADSRYSAYQRDRCMQHREYMDDPRLTYVLNDWHFVSFCRPKVRKMLRFSNFWLTFISENRPFVGFFAQFVTRISRVLYIMIILANFYNTENL